jgi:uncharacterized protein
MASLLLRLLLFVSLFWLVNRLWSSFARASKRTGADKKAPAPRNNMVKDPVCGMYMDPGLAFRLEKRDEVFFFCSEKCKTEYTTARQKNAPDFEDSSDSKGT